VKAREPFPIVYAQDIARSEQFYCDAFGFEAVFRFPAQGPSDFVYLQLEPSGIGLGAADGENVHGRPVAPGAGSFELFLYVDDMDEARARLLALGAPGASCSRGRAVGRAASLLRGSRRQRDPHRRQALELHQHHPFELGQLTLRVTGITADQPLMRPFPRDRVVQDLALIGAAAIVPGASLQFFGQHAHTLGTNMHFFGVGVGAVMAAVAALALTIIGVRREDGRVVLVGTAFTVMAALLAIHGLATPGVVIGDNGIIALTGAMTLPVGGGVLALSALPGLRRPQGIRSLLVLQAVALVSVLGLGIAGMAIPSLVPAVPEPDSPPAIVALVVGGFFYSLLLLRALKTYLLTQRTTDLAVVVGVAWLTAALPPALLMNYTELGWWLGHGFELAGIIIVGAAVAVDLHHSVQSHPLVGDLRAAELVAKEEAFLGARVHALLERLAEKDESTEEHTRRVALRAVQVGEELGLPPGRLRALAIGGLLHDMGKLSVPERILKKPGALEEDEFDVIRKHPQWGIKLLRELGGFTAPVHELVHSHHERLDGKGYPRGLEGCSIGLDTRILTVCDVYDALVSPRVYRGAWSHEDAIGLLRGEIGAAFDERCVAALESVLGREEPRRDMPALRVAPAPA
jgi:catechol 2,3-dioxygenase-like lactoylglutathione lyase family enzyme